MQADRPGSSQQLTLKQVEAALKQELADAEAWYAGIRQDELEWIRSGTDVDAAFTEKYYQNSPAMVVTQPMLPPAPPAPAPRAVSSTRVSFLSLGLVTVVLLVVGVVVVGGIAAAMLNVRRNP